MTPGELINYMRAHIPQKDFSPIEDLGLTNEEYAKAVDETIFGKEESPSSSKSKICPRYDQESASEDLEKEIKRYQQEIYDRDTTVKDIARHFARWQREQMMNNAVDAECLMLPYPDLFKVLICDKATDNLANHDQVKIIIVRGGGVTYENQV